MSYPWGKSESDRSGYAKRFHGLLPHCLDVSETFERLLRNDHLRRALARSAGLDDLTGLQVRRLAYLAAWHDIGKLQLGFALKVSAKHRALLQRQQITCRDHTLGALPLFDNPLRPEFERAIALNEVAGWFQDQAAFTADEQLDGMLVASLSHHGWPLEIDRDPAEIAKIGRGWTKAGRFEPVAQLHAFGANLRRHYADAFVAGDTLTATPEFQDVFCGLVSLADFVASGQQIGDQNAFTYGGKGLDRAPFSRAVARRALQQIGLDQNVAPAIPAGVTAEQIIGGPTRACQQAMADLPLMPRGGLALLEAETGSGKTDAALIWFLRNYAAGLVDGVYFALPTRTSATQMHRRITEAMQRLFGLAAPACVLAVPGYVQVDRAQGTLLPNFKVTWDGDTNPGGRGWAAQNSMRYFAAPIVVGTIDQAMMSEIRAKHAAMRGSLLARHMLVVDEVHASDHYMTAIGERLVRYHADLGSQVLLMSATCGADLRAQLFNQTTPAYKDACRHAYPLVTYRQTGGAVRSKRIPRTQSREVRIDLCRVLHTPERIARIAFKAAAMGGKILVIANTVRRAIAIQRAIEALAERAGRQDLLFTLDGKATLHHSRFSPADRRRMDDAAVAGYGKSSPGGACILVSTQTMEQSIDIDADLLVTDIAPMDVLVQRLGRMHRGKRPRPAGFEFPRAIVAYPRGGFEHLLDAKRDGFGYAYTDLRVMQCTLDTLRRKKVFSLPKHSRWLIESALHAEALQDMVNRRTTSGHSSIWQFHTAEVTGKTTGDIQLAKAALRDRDVSYAHGDKERGEASETVKTRLGLNDVTAHFHPALDGPFGPVSELRIPGWMIDDPEDGTRPQIFGNLSVTGERIVFGYGMKTPKKGARPRPALFIYDRLGLRPATPDGEEVDP
ncbi:CRISPR-associated helicase Cas3' [Rhodovibrio sodomensis]|uniref:CRISPR-associated helicase Cas3 n=1 Tax=Rhodovibrio sodomensis TaxID=1088 RepID=A0ABS1DF40_9PROT|nr:CRISPR-associated helicase Cas3' [Rhodovibrio sodomensis]MBK1669091.1 CRISPR-associated helicase Cas3' [Rhodovibrio sodomensis]